MKKVGIIGVGKMGAHLENRLKDQRIRVCFALGQDAPDQLVGAIGAEKPQAVFLTISTKDTGEAARDYILTCVREGVPIITCEKGALAYYAKPLKPFFKMIGSSAACGGGTRMMQYAAARVAVDRRTKISVVLNGTLNYIFDEMSRGRSLAEACQEAVHLGITEPGSTDPLSLVNGELRDVLMKTCVFFNLALGNGTFITPDNLSPVFEQTRGDLERLSSNGGDCRFVVSFSNQATDHALPTIGRGFLRQVDDWIVSGAFVQVSKKEKRFSWIPDGLGNAMQIETGTDGASGICKVDGTGAGYEPTTTAMLADFIELTR